MTSSLAAVICNEELSRRPARPADPAAESEALEEIAGDLSHSPRHVLQSLADAALRLCRAHSAGISLLERRGGMQVLRWHAVSGAWRGYLRNTLPRRLSPCGPALDRKAPQFLVLPERHFACLKPLQPAVSEVLVAPFSVQKELIGTVWVLAHDDTRRFDAEDGRIVANLAKIAAVAHERLTSIGTDDVLRMARLRKEGRAPAPVPGAIRKRVLVVDDDVDAAESLAVLLRLMDHRVYTAKGRRAALHAAREVRPDIVLLEVRLPGMDATVVAREMRQFLDPGVLVFAVTLPAKGERPPQAGFDGHIARPVIADLLRGVIR